MELSLCLLGQFAVRIDDQPVEIAPAAQRVLALTALYGRSVDRSRVAGTLWPERTEERSLANLRGVLWRLAPPVRERIGTQGPAITLGGEWTIDVERAAEAAASLHRSDRARDVGLDRDLFTTDLLPDWDNDWLTILRERHRQLRLHALEDLAAAELGAGRPLDAVDTCLAALATEPLRESTQLLSLRAHLAAGNRATAIEQYGHFAELLRTQLGVEPSPEMQHTIATATAR